MGCDKNDNLRLILRMNFFNNKNYEKLKKGKVPLKQEVINKFFYIYQIDYKNQLY